MNIIDIGTKAADMLTGGVISGILDIGQDDRQLEQQKRLNREALNNSKQFATHQRREQHQLWLDTGIRGQMEEAIKAGINPNAIFSKGGNAGQTGSGAPIMAAGNAGDPNAGTRNAIDLAMQQAQVANLNASTKKMEAEAAKTAGADTDLTNANASLTQLQADLAEIEKGLQKRTLDQQVNIIWQQAMEAEGRAMEQVNKGIIARETQQAEITKIKQEATNAIIHAAAIKKGIELDQAKINDITTSIMQRWKQLNLTETSNNWEHADRLKAIEEYTEAMLWGAGIQGVTNIANTAAQVITKQAPTPKWSQTGKSLKTEYDGAGNPLKQTRYENWQKK